MSRRYDLEQSIRESYELIREYENIIRVSDDPRDRVRAQRVIQEQWSLIEGYLMEYRSLVGGDFPSGIAEIAAHFAPVHGVDFLLVTALEEERDAVLAELPGYRRTPPSQADVCIYFQAELPVTFLDGQAGTYQVIVMSLLGMGRVQTAAATADAIRRWRPRYVVLVGIAGGIAARGVRIGDILIADQIVDYGLQKLTPQGPQIRWEVHRADPRLLNACHNFMEESWQELVQLKRPDRSKPKRHTGPIASGDKLIAFSDVLEGYRKVWPKLIGVEMEAAGVATAAFQSSEAPGFFMVRCTSDLADEHKSSPNVGEWRSYACGAAASFAIALLKSGPVPYYSIAATSKQVRLEANSAASTPMLLQTIDRNVLGLERCLDVTSVRRLHRQMFGTEASSPTNQILREFSRVSRDVDAALNQQDAYSQRLSLVEVQKRLSSLLQNLLQSKDDFANRLRIICSVWQQIIIDYMRELSQDADKYPRIDSPYIVALPLTVQEEIFVGRTDVGIKLERLLLTPRCPPLLLYGQRRMGKTSLLKNLRRLLPSAIVPLFVDLQSASAASAHAGFLYNIVRQMTESARSERNLALPAMTRGTLEGDPFIYFDEWLSRVETVLESNMALLMFDEFETLDQALSQGRFNETDVLGMLRHLIQHRPRFKVLLAGSHTLEELQRWASYLINVQVVHIGYLKEAEARQLVERPVKDFALRYEPDACQRVLHLTRGHPCLVQMLCNEVVALKNEQDPPMRFLASLDDVEATVPEAFKSGSFFFADIQRNQVDDNGLAVLRFIAAQGEGVIVDLDILSHRFPNNLDHTLEQLVRRELLELASQDIRSCADSLSKIVRLWRAISRRFKKETDGGYRFQVELIRRWFAQSAF